MKRVMYFVVFAILMVMGTSMVALAETPTLPEQVVYDWMG